MNILYADIETSPMVAYLWGLIGNNYVNPENIVEDWSILSIGWAWNDGSVQYADTSSKRNPRDDKSLVRMIHGLLSSADLVVAHNGVRFDMRKIRARMLVHGMAPPPPTTVFDTKKAAKKVAAFSSNKLAWLAPLLTDQEKEKHGKFPGLELWKECLAGNAEAWREMQSYNRQDVEALRAIFKRLRPWVTAGPAVAYEETETGYACPKCGSGNVQKRGFRRSGTGVFQLYQCQACGGWSSERAADKKRRTLKEEA